MTSREHDNQVDDFSILPNDICSVCRTRPVLVMRIDWFDPYTQLNTNAAMVTTRKVGTLATMYKHMYSRLAFASADIGIFNHAILSKPSAYCYFLLKNCSIDC